jgi:hypothetical protein
MLAAPQTSDAEVVICIALAGAGAGRLFFTWIMRWSPGYTWKVGDSLPCGVVKQKKSPTVSVDAGVIR